jgi:hypothetical protein
MVYAEKNNRPSSSAHKTKEGAPKHPLFCFALFFDPLPYFFLVVVFFTAFFVAFFAAFFVAI